MPIYFIDRMNHKEELEAKTGEYLLDVLKRNNIPYTSIITTENNRPIDEYRKVDLKNEYIIKLIEGYDINNIRNIYQQPDAEDGTVYCKRQLLFDRDGSLILENKPLDLDSIVDYVESTMQGTFEEYQLTNRKDKVLIGLSGGVDSSTLLMVLSKLKSKLDFDIVCATFEDFDSKVSPTFENAKKLSSYYGVEHKLIKSSIIEEVFNLNKPLRQILPELMQTEASHITMYIDHHTTRRALEVFAEDQKIENIALGLHRTDLIAGLLNSYYTGYYIADIPKRKIGTVNYIYPLAFISKKELHLYYYSQRKKFAEHSYPNQWELNPKDRNYYYYLADQLQTLSPGIEHYFFEAHSMRLKREPKLIFTTCKNCGSHILQQVVAPINPEICDACYIFNKYNYINK